MYAKILKWGNSHAIRLPKVVIELAGFNEDDDIQISSSKGQIIIKKAKRHKTLEERIKDYNGDYKCTEWETGGDIGNEVIY